MKLVVGLGNPGVGYEDTRHNVGFLLVDKLQKIKLPSGVVVRKSDVFMNDSGTFIKKMIKQYGLNSQDLYVIHDDLDIPLGSYKIQFGIGPKVHNGVNSVEEELETKDFWRIRVGVENRNKELGISGEEYVLQDFAKEEKEVLDKTLKEAAQKLVSNLQSPDTYDK